MRDAEGLVQAEMADISASPGRDRPTCAFRIGAIEMDLAAIIMHNLADLADMLLEQAVGRG